MVEEPVLAQNFVVFWQEYHGTHWEIKFLRASAEPLFTQMLAYISGYAQLTSHNERLFRQLFKTRSAAVKGEQLRLLAESGGFLKKV